MAIQVVHDHWDQYLTSSADKVLFISFDAAAKGEDLAYQLPYCARIIVPIKQPNHNGGPAGPESERLYAMEDQLCEALANSNVQCRLVGRMTHDGTRELVFQVATWDAFRPPVRWWIQQNGDYRISVSEDEGWDFFNEIIRPGPADWVWMRDRDVVMNLEKAGSDPNKIHTIDFTFLGPSSALKQAAAELAKRGYRSRGKINYDSGEMTAIKQLPLDLATIHDESLANHELAKRLGISFDGWGAMVVP